MSEKSKKVMLINVTHAEESRVAILSEGTLEAFEIEIFDQRSTKGNIYKGRIETVHTGLQACFVDIGEDRAAFLPLDEVNFAVHPSRKEGGKGKIENHLQRGQELLVQVVRDAYGSKPPTLSTYYSLPGRFLVLTPHDTSQGISRKLSDEQRERIRSVIEALSCPDGFGLIARTAGATATKVEIQRDLKYLLRLWEKIEQAAKTRAPKLIYQERSLVIRTIRDLFGPDIDEILVDDPVVFEEILTFFSAVLPHKKNAVKHYQGERPIFNKHNLEEQIENIFRRRVPLPSGGALVFDTTEALTSIDVNSGRMKQEGHIEETALRANLEAATEIGRQLSLRDLGGLVVIDFIDMRAAKNIRQVEKKMKEALKRDKARYDVTRISRLGLMEISRQRLNPNKTSLRYTDCPTCDGTGSVKTVEAAALQALRRLQTRVVRGDLENLELGVAPDVAAYILNQKRRELSEWERRYRTEIVVFSDADLGRDDCKLETVARPKQDAARPIVSAPVHEEILAEIETEPVEEEAENDEDTPAKKKRRRRRRRRKNKAGADESAESGDESTEDAPAAAEAGEASKDGQEAADADEQVEAGASPDDNGDAAPAKKKRRRRRRRRKSRKTGDDEAASGEAAESGSPASEGEDTKDGMPPLAAIARDAIPEGEELPRPRWWRELIEV